MGCFNETCGISSVPIRDGEPVRMMIIKHVNPLLWNISPFSTFVPVTFPVSGKYDDYGGIDMEEPEAARYRQMIVDHKLEDIFEKQEATEFDQRRLKTRIDDESPYRLWFCHQDLWDALPSLTGGNGDPRYYSTLGQSLEKRRAKVIEHQANVYKTRELIHSLDKSVSETLKEELYLTLMMNRDSMRDIIRFDSMNTDLFQAKSPINDHMQTSTPERYLTLVELTIKFINPFFEIGMLYEALHLLQRQLIAPAVFTQQYHENAQKFMGQYILDKAKAYLEEMGE